MFEISFINQDINQKYDISHYFITKMVSENTENTGIFSYRYERMQPSLHFVLQTNPHFK